MKKNGSSRNGNSRMNAGERTEAAAASIMPTAPTEPFDVLLQRMTAAKPSPTIWNEVSARTAVETEADKQRDVLRLLCERYLANPDVRCLIFRKGASVYVLRREATGLGVETKGFEAVVVEDRLDKVIVRDSRKHNHTVAPCDVRLRGKATAPAVEAVETASETETEIPATAPAETATEIPAITPAEIPAAAPVAADMPN